MNIAIIYHSLRSVGGAENAIVWLAESLSNGGHRVVLFTHEYNELVWGDRRDKPYAVHVLDVKRGKSSFLMNRETGRVLGEALKQYAFDIVNPHSYPASLWVYYARNNGTVLPKVVLYLHNLTRHFYEEIINTHYRQLPEFRKLGSMWDKYRPKSLLRELRRGILGYRKLDRDAITSCDKVLTNSRYSSELVKAIYGVNAEPCLLGIPKPRLYDAGCRRSRSEENRNDDVMILSVARLELQKNIGTILDAVAILRRKESLPMSFSYKIAGDGPCLEYYKRKAQGLGLQSMVHFLGFVAHEKVWNLYADARFLVHLPLDEPYGLVPIEAALCRKPAIVSDHGGPAEIVLDGQTGLHANALDATNVAAKMEELFEDPEKVKRLGEAAFDRVAKTMTWEIFLGEFEGHLREAIGPMADCRKPGACGELYQRC